MKFFFCDVCGVRVSDADLRSGLGMRRRHDVICATCLELGHGRQWAHLPRGATYDADLRRLALECQLAGGDDYELCFTTPPQQSNAVSAIAARLDLPLWCIGSMVEGRAGEVTVFDHRPQSGGISAARLRPLWLNL